MSSPSPAGAPRADDMLAREKIANRPKHWVRAVTACNSKCLFCLDMDTPRNVFIPDEDVKADLLRGREELGAEKVIISGGEASLHPQFIEFVRYAKEIGYERVQTVTNGYRFADDDFFEAALSAGLGEITYSIHGHTAALHDHLTQTRGAFKRITKAIGRSVRDGRPIVNVDVCINKQNVPHLDKLVELCIQLGVTEFDLLHVIPQAAAFEHRDELFYDPLEHLPVLHKVFKLNRHPAFVVWTNRFPVPFLEGMEDLIQDPHKMLDEINGRRFQVRRYLDTGEALDCRDPERCQHCFIEPMCNTMDDVIARQHEGRWDVFWVGEGEGPEDKLPFGCSALGINAATPEDVVRRARAGRGLYVRTESDAPLSAFSAAAEAGGLTLVATRVEQLEAWLPEADPSTDATAGAPLPDIEIELRADLAAWLFANAARLKAHRDRLLLVQPSYEKMADAAANDIPQLPRFLAALGDRAGELKVAGVPDCLAPGLRVVERPAILPSALFEDETGRLGIRELARMHVESRYAAKSLRCRDCRSAVEERCAGAHINYLRHAGLAQLSPVGEGAVGDAMERHARERSPLPLPQLSKGALPIAAAPSLPGYEQPTGAVRDPLAIIAEEQLIRKARRREKGARVPRTS